MKNRTHIFRPVTLVILMALPFGAGIAGLAVGVNEGWKELKRGFLASEPWKRYDNRSIAFLSDGTQVVRENKTVGPRQWTDRYVHLNGESVTAKERKQVLGSQYMIENDNWKQHPFNVQVFHDLLTDRNRLWSTRDPENWNIEWVWEAVDGAPSERILVARYRNTRAFVSVATPAGFHSEMPANVKGFPSPHSPREDYDDGLIAFRSKESLFALDLKAETVVEFPISIGDNVGWSVIRELDERPWRVAIRKSGSITVFSELGEKLFEVKKRDNTTDRSALYATNDDHFIVAQSEASSEELSSAGEKTRTWTTFATWLDKNGRTIKTAEFENVYIAQQMDAASPVVTAIDRFLEKAEAGLCLPEPAVVCAVIFMVLPLAHSLMGSQKPSSEVISDALERAPYAIPFAAIVGLLCAIACWRRQVRYQADWTKTWVVFVFLFGLPAWIAWRVHRRWPPLEIATVSESDFVGPELNGLEIR